MLHRQKNKFEFILYTYIILSHHFAKSLIMCKERFNLQQISSNFNLYILLPKLSHANVIHFVHILLQMFLECEFDGTCRFDDVISAADYDARDLVGTWYMIGHATPSDMNVYETYTAQYLYVHDDKLEFAVSGVTK